MQGAKEYWGIKRRMSLSVPNEGKLGLCGACDCLLSLKVHVPLEHILKWTDNETMDRFHPACWILNE